MIGGEGAGGGVSVVCTLCIQKPPLNLPKVLQSGVPSTPGALMCGFCQKTRHLVPDKTWENTRMWKTVSDPPKGLSYTPRS